MRVEEIFLTPDDFKVRTGAPKRRAGIPAVRKTFEGTPEQPAQPGVSVEDLGTGDALEHVLKLGAGDRVISAVADADGPNSIEIEVFERHGGTEARIRGPSNLEGMVRHTPAPERDIVVVAKPMHFTASLIGVFVKIARARKS